VASTHGLGIDNLLNFYRHEPNEEEAAILHSFSTQTQLHHRLAQPYISSASASLLRHFTEGFHQGITVTCPGFYGPQGRMLRLGLSQPELIDRLTGFSYGPHRITNFEMETAGHLRPGQDARTFLPEPQRYRCQPGAKQFSRDGNATVERLIQETLRIIEIHHYTPPKKQKRALPVRGKYPRKHPLLVRRGAVRKN
jgi:uridine phosphorylase